MLLLYLVAVVNDDCEILLLMMIIMKTQNSTHGKYISTALTGGLSVVFFFRYSMSAASIVVGE